MKKLKNFGAKSAPKAAVAAARREKLQADGKWFWLFKRGAVWLSIILVSYGLGGIFLPETFDFQSNQLLILSGMFGAFLVNSVFEWSKMEKSYQEQHETN
jgi:hypothetical protein